MSKAEAGRMEAAFGAGESTQRVGAGITFYTRKISSYYEKQLDFGNRVEHSPQKNLRSIFDARIIHAHFPSMIERIYGSLSRGV